MFPDRPPPLDPRDRVLLKPLSSLGKSTANPSSVSFLRRTEYITGHKTTNDGGNALRLSNALRTSQRPKFVPPKSVAKPDKNDAAAMLRNIEKSFNLAYPKDAYTGPDTMEHIRGADITPAERDAWDNPKHPSKPGLKLLDSYPIIPDIASLGQSGAYFLVKFNTNPTTSTAVYDRRLDYTILVPADDGLEEYQALVEKHEQDPTKHPKPEPLAMNFSAYLPDGDPDAVIGPLKRKLDVFDADKDDPDLYTHDVADDGEDQRDPFFMYKKLRPYETVSQTYIEADDDYTKFNDTVAIALHDGSEGTTRGGAHGPQRQKAAYVYPLNQRTFMRPKRPKVKGVGMMAQLGQTTKGQVDDTTVDLLHVRMRDMNEEEKLDAATYKLRLDPHWVE
jgi:hypothetical protein